MTVAKPIAAISLASALAVTSSALAAPAGSEYLPQVPKASHHHSGGESSPSTGYSDTSSGYTSTDSSTGSGGQQPKHAKAQTQNKHQKAKNPVPVKQASAEADTGSGGALRPLALLLAGGVLVTGSGFVLRRRQTGRLAYQAGQPRPRIADTGKQGG